MLFNVVLVVDGDTFEVRPDWEWRGERGRRVRPTGFNAPELWTKDGPAFKEKLERLILHRQVDLRNPVYNDRGRLVCDVYFKGINLADYYKEFKKEAA